jgi:V/A-type H+-transporting ATPase subunit E
MSLETVVEDIQDEARARAKEIREEGDERAEAILDEAREDAEAIREDAERAAEDEIAQERKQKLSSAKLEAKQTRLEARRDVLEEVYDEVEASVAGLEGDRREELTRELLEAGRGEFDADEDVLVYGRADDRELLEGILEEYDGFEVAGERDCLGGVVLEGDRSRLRVNNTFDSILEDVWEDNLKEVSDRLFEDE